MLNTETVLELAHKGNISDIISLCEKSLKEESVKSSGGTSAVKQYKAALKLISEDKNNRCYGSYIENGKQYFTNGYIAFELNNPIKNLPEYENKIEVKKIFDNLLSDREQVDVPDITELRAKFKMAKAEKSASNNKFIELYRFENGRYTHEDKNRKWECSIENILKIVDIMGDEFTWYLPIHNRLSMALIENDNGRAILLPVNLKENI